MDEVIEMYLELHMWDECIAAAEAKVITHRRAAFLKQRPKKAAQIYPRG